MEISNKNRRNVKQTHFSLIYSWHSTCCNLCPSYLLEDSLCSLILSHRNFNNLCKSLWRERVVCYSAADTDKSFQPHLRWLNYFGRHVSQFNHVLQGKITTVFTFYKKKKKIVHHELHLHLLSSGLLWWHPQRTPVGRKEKKKPAASKKINMTGKLVLTQNNIKAAKAYWLKVQLPGLSHLS